MPTAAKRQPNRTTLDISKLTRERLHEVGRHGESFDTIINRILDSYKVNSVNLP